MPRAIRARFLENAAGRCSHVDSAPDNDKQHRNGDMTIRSGQACERISYIESRGPSVDLFWQVDTKDQTMTTLAYGL